MHAVDSVKRQNWVSLGPEAQDHCRPKELRQGQEGGGISGDRRWRAGQRPPGLGGCRGLGAHSP